MVSAATVARRFLASLRDSDKRVVEAFVQQRPAEGRILSTDGRALWKTSFGGDKMAIWRGSKIAIVSTESVKSDETILRYLVKVGGKNLVTWSYDRAGFEKSLRFETGGDSFYRDQYDGWVAAYVPGRDQAVGRLDWSAFQGKFKIKMIEVAPEFKRTGVGRELMRYFMRQESIEKKDIDPGYTTEEGTPFWRHLGG
jgi:hypothetical protein